MTVGVLTRKIFRRFLNVADLRSANKIGSPSPFTSLEEFPNFVEVVVELDSLSLLLALVVTEKLAEVKSVKL